MLFIHPHVELLPIADAGAGVRDFIDRRRFPPGGAAGQHRMNAIKAAIKYQRIAETFIWLFCNFRPPCDAPPGAPVRSNYDSARVKVAQL